MSTTTHHQQQPDDDDLLDAQQVAREEFGGKVSPRTIESWRGQNRAQPLAFIRVGGKCLYRRGEVRRFVAARVVAPKEAA